METVLAANFNSILFISFQNLNFANIAALFVLLLLLTASATASISEVALFSLTPENKKNIQNKNGILAKKTMDLLDKPEKLLATFLIANNFVNIGIVILSAYLINSMVNFNGLNDVLVLILKVISVVFLILLFGEIVPKVYASQHAEYFAIKMSKPVFAVYRLFSPLSSFLVFTSRFFSEKITGKKTEISLEELSNKLELTHHSIKDSKNILEGIVNYGNTDAKEIMIPRVDIIAFNINTTFNNLLEKIKKENYSRIPVYFETLDHVKGVLFVKDLLPHYHKQTFNWQSLVRPAYFVPESKKINDLLLDFQTKKIHMAIVIDEYGGTSGLVTLEDVLEEIVGELVDDSDDDDELFKLKEDGSYIFEGKILLIDLYKIMKLNDDFFDDIRGDAETLAGLILELQGEIPKIGSVFEFNNYTFKIISADKRRIKQINVSFKNPLNNTTI